MTNSPIIGQKAIAGGGSTQKYVGTVVDFVFEKNWCSDITVRHPITNVDTKYASHNVKLIAVTGV